MAPNTVFVYDRTGEVINSFVINVAEDNFPIWRE
jgi:hypothetical protein